MKSNISKHFAAKAKQGLRFANGLVQDQMVEGAPNNAPWTPSAGQSALLSSYDARMGAANQPTAPVSGGLTQGEQSSLAIQSDMNNLGTVNPTPGLGQGAQHNFFNKSMSDLQGGNNQPYTPGSANDPHASTSIGPKGPTRLPQASPSRTPLRQWQEPAFADGVVPATESPAELSARIAAKYGVSGNAPVAAPQPAPVQQPVQQAPKPQAGGLLGGALGLIKDRSAQMKAAAGFADGEVPKGQTPHVGPGIVHGPGGPRDDLKPAYLSPTEAVLPSRTVMAMGGPDAVADLIEQTNGKAPARGLRDGVHAARGLVDTVTDAVAGAVDAVKAKVAPPVDYDIPAYKRNGAAGPVSEEALSNKVANDAARATAQQAEEAAARQGVVNEVKRINAGQPEFGSTHAPSSASSAGSPANNRTVTSQAITPKAAPTAVKGLVRTTGGATLGAGMEVANKFSTMPIIGGDPTEVANRKSFYNDPNVKTGDKFVNGMRDLIDIGLPVAGGTIGTVAGSGVMTLPLAAGGTYAGTKLAQGAQSLMGDSPLDRYNHKNAMAASEAERAKLMPVHNQMVEQGHMPDGSTASDKNIRPNLLPAVDKAGAKKTLDQAMAATDVNTMSERMAPETIEKVGLRQLTRDTMGKDAAIPEGAKFAFNQDGTPQMRWSGNTDEAAKTIPRGLNTTNVVKDGGGIVSFNRGNGKFDNVSLGETKYMGKDGTMGAWDKTQQFEDATKLAAKDKALLAEIQYQRAKFNATSDEITDPRARAAGMRGLIQHNAEATNQAAMLKAMREAGTAAETARHNRAMEAQGVETARRAQQGQDQMQRNNRSDAFNKRYDALITEANTSEGKDGKLIVNQDGMNRMRANIGKRVDLSKMSVDDLNSSFADMVAEHNVAETLRKSAENRPTLAKARDWVNGITPEVGGNTSMKIRAAKGGRDGDWTDVGLWDAAVTGRKVIEIGGHVRELDEVLAPNGVLDRQAYDVVKRHLKQQGDEKSLKKLNKKYGE